MTEHLPEWEKFSRNQFDAGYAAGVDAAREVVASFEYRPTHLETMIRSIVLAAIDALKEKR